jgi:hypothetical protein
MHGPWDVDRLPDHHHDPAEHDSSADDGASHATYHGATHDSASYHCGPLTAQASG